MELASSHSSDDEDEFDLNPNWANQVPKSRAVGESMAGQAVVNEILQKFCIVMQRIMFTTFSTRKEKLFQNEDSTVQFGLEFSGENGCVRECCV